MTAKKNLAKTIGIIVIALIAIGGFIGYKAYELFLGASVTGNEKYLYVYTNDTYDSVLNRIKEQKIVKDAEAFDYVAQKMNYPSSVKPGRYRLIEGMGNRRLVGDLRGGFQEAVELKFSNIRLKENFAAFLGKRFEADSAQFLAVLNDASIAEKYGFNKDNFYAMFIPNTYEIYWNTAPEKVIDRLHEEYKKFWTAERLEKAKQQNLSPIEVSILASIVRGEALHTDEMPMIAGLYLNRLKKGMLLQADPTVIFANNDFTIRRV